MSAAFWVGCATGAGVALVAVPVALRSAPKALVRVNVHGAEVPAVLGLPLACGAIAAVFSVALVDSLTGGLPSSSQFLLRGAAVLVVLIMFLGGLADDLRGDEAERGWGGHLRALRSGRITGGLVKIAAGGVAGVIAGLVIGGGPLRVVETALLVALGANLVNLFDRAPGRAAKVALVWAAPLVVVAPGWAVAASGMLGGLAAVIGFDLRERAMLGDSGSNPLGAILGLGLAVALGTPGRIAVLVLLLALNLVSERVSFSRVIDEVGWLRGLDRLGRK